MPLLLYPFISDRHHTQTVTVMLYHPGTSTCSERLVLMPEDVSDTGGWGRLASTAGWTVLPAHHMHLLQKDSWNDRDEKIWGLTSTETGQRLRRWAGHCCGPVALGSTWLSLCWLMIVSLAGSLGLELDRVQLLHPRPQDPGVQMGLWDTPKQTDHNALLQREMNDSHCKLSS